MDAVSIFEKFVQASTFRCIQQTFFQLCCALDIHPCDSTNVYRRLRQLDNEKLYSKAGKLWSLLDKKWNQLEYAAQEACNQLNVLIVGAGPCGLRAAIECALLGAHVIVVEQRDKFSRNNVLHLWNFVIQDLKALGAKIFFPKFCTGSIEHISIRRLQCILLKVALVFGVQVYGNVSFISLVEPYSNSVKGDCGWKAHLEPHGHILSDYEFNVLIGADGKRNTIAGFPRKIVRGKLAIGITANFVNGRTAIEEKVMEISGVAYIFNQSFFNEMMTKTGIDLENIVYYKDDTHYFVMSAKKQSLLQKGVIRKDYDDIPTLLSKNNIDQEMLCKYAAQAADFATNGKLPQLTFARNANGEPDVAMFDFTALSSAVYCTRLLERRSRNLITAIVGDSLHEPFWPTGSGCARGFLGVLDTAWMLRNFGLDLAGPMEIIAERENVYKLLAQTTKENLRVSCSKYTIDPKTRYKRVDDASSAEDVCEQIDTDMPRLRPTSKPLSLRIAADREETQNLSPEFSRRLRLWLLCYRILLLMKLRVINFKVQSWGDGKALARLIEKFRPDLLDYTTLCKNPTDGDELLEASFSSMELHYQIMRPCSANVFEWSELSDEQRTVYIESVVCSLFADEQLMNNAILSVAEPMIINGSATVNGEERRRLTSSKTTSAISSTTKSSFTSSVDSNSSVIVQKTPQTTTKRPSLKKLNPAMVNKVDRIVSGSWEKEKIQKFYNEKSRTTITQQQARCQAGYAVAAAEPSTKIENSTSVNKISKIAPQLDLARQRQKCTICGVEAYLAEQMCLEKMIIHKRCFKCSYCGQPLRLGNCTVDHQLSTQDIRLLCAQHSHLQLADKLIKPDKYRYTKWLEKSPAKDDYAPASSCMAARTLQRIRWRQLDADDIQADIARDRIPKFNKPKENVATLAERESQSLINYRQRKSIDALKSLKRDSVDYLPLADAFHVHSTPHSSNGMSYSSNDARRSSPSSMSFLDSELADYGASSSSEEDEDTWAEFTEMLEGTFADGNYLINADFHSEKNIKNLIDKFNIQQASNGTVYQRFSRTSFGSTNDLYRTSAHDASVYVTPKSSFPAQRKSISSNYVKPLRLAQNSLHKNGFGEDQDKHMSNNNDILSRREMRLMRSNPRRATINIDVRTAQIDVNGAQKNSETETVYSTTELSEPTSGVLIRKQRRDRLRNKNLYAEVQDIGRLSSNRRRARSQSSANFSELLSSFRTMLKENNDKNSTQKRVKLPPTPENISRAKRSAENVMKCREKAQKLDAYQIRHSLDEIESRINQVRAAGTDFERRLRADSQNEWLLENWVFYSEELCRLKAREEQLSKRVELINFAEKYQRLRDELHEVQRLSGRTDELVLSDGLEKERSLMEQMLEVIGEHEAVRAEMKMLADNATSQRSKLAIEEIRQILADKQYDFANFEPIFL